MKVTLASAAFLAACSHGSAAPPSHGSDVSASSGVNTAGSSGTLALGERITAPQVSLAEVARNPGSFDGRVFATSGKVTAVCQEMGCWMQLEDSSGKAHVRMHGHTFFVPKTAPGHVARVQGTIVEPTGGAEDCANGRAAKIELDATGVEID